jgi:hypothetical protein
VGLRRPVTGFPSWTDTVSTMLSAGGDAAGRGVRVMCARRCSRGRTPDFEAIIAAKGPDFSLVNKRFPCRWKPHCTGWIRPYFQSGVIRPLWDDATASRWIEEDQIEREHWQALTAAGLHRLGTFRDRFTVGVVDLDSLLTTEDLDVILGRRVRTHGVKPIEDATRRGEWKQGGPAPAEPPLGVDPSLWKNAPDDRARRMLIRKVRG